MLNAIGNLQRLSRLIARSFLRNSGNKRVLIVSAETYETFRRLCSRLRLELVYSMSLPRALLSLRDERFDVVIYDRELPQQDWRAAISALAQASPTSSILLLSPAIQPDLWSEVIRKGGHDMIGKPVSEERAESTLALAMARAKLDRFSSSRKMMVL